MESTLRNPHGIRLDGTTLWVIHRGTEYGPFDYAWSPDLCGVELHFRGQKFGEYCAPEEIFADLKEFRLPMTVVQVGSLALGCVVFAVLNSLKEPERAELLIRKLTASGFGRFADNISRKGL